MLTVEEDYSRMHGLLNFGGVPKRPTGADCKSAGYAFVGSNPTPSTKLVEQVVLHVMDYYDFMSCITNWSSSYLVWCMPHLFDVDRIGREYRGGCSSMVEPQPSKLMVWVRSPSPAPI
jgi:hypothetical protein